MLRNLKTPLKGLAVLSIVLLAAPFIKTDAALAGGFARSCENERLAGRGDVFLVARCRRVDGSYADALVNLSFNIANRDGNLRWGGGGFNRSCRNIQYVPAFAFLSAECGDGRGGWRRTTLELDSRLTNRNGALLVDR